MSRPPLSLQAPLLRLVATCLVFGMAVLRFAARGGADDGAAAGWGPLSKRPRAPPPAGASCAPAPPRDKNTSEPGAHAHGVTATTHKTLRGPRGGPIPARGKDKSTRKLNSVIFPGTPGGPLVPACLL